MGMSTAGKDMVSTMLPNTISLPFKLICLNSSSGPGLRSSCVICLIQ